MSCPGGKVERGGPGLVDRVAGRLVAEQQPDHLLVPVEGGVVEGGVAICVPTSNSTLGSAERGKWTRFLWLDAGNEL